MPKKLTISIPDDLASKMEKYPEDWPEICRQAINENIRKKEAKPLEVEKGLTFSDFLNEASIPKIVFDNYSEFMKNQLRDKIYPQWYDSKKSKT